MATELRQLITDRLKRIVPLSSPSFQKGQYQAKVIAVATSKGGVGKTTTAVSLAVGLAKYHHKKVLLVDLDSQGHVSAYFSTQSPTISVSVSELLLDSKQRRRELLEAAYPTSVLNLHMSAPDKTLSETENLLSSKIGKEFILKGLIEISKTHYDFIIFDCPPNLGNLTLNALLASQYLLIPSDLTVLSLEGIHDIFSTVETVHSRLNHRLNILGILSTRVDRRNKSLNQTLEQSLKELYGHFVLGVEIPLSASVTRAQLESKNIFDYDEQSSVSVAYKQSIDEILQRL